MTGGAVTTGRCDQHVPCEHSTATSELRLEVEFCGQTWMLGRDESLGFGRDSDCVIDDANRYLHRVAGRFRHEAGHWWLQNEGAHLPLMVLEAVGRPMVVLPPGVETTLWPGDFAVILEAGPARYELRGTCPDPAGGDTTGRSPIAPEPVADEADHTAVGRLRAERRPTGAAGGAGRTPPQRPPGRTRGRATQPTGGLASWVDALKVQSQARSPLWSPGTPRGTWASRGARHHRLQTPTEPGEPRPHPPIGESRRFGPTRRTDRNPTVTDLLTTSTLGSNVPDPDADCTRTAVGGRDFQRPRIGPSVPSGATPLVRRRIKPVPPGPAVTFIPFPDPDDAEPADDWDRRADRLQWWMADLGGPHPVTVETTENPVGASRTLDTPCVDLGWTSSRPTKR